MSLPRLAVFDCDGTLADSQHAIVSAMHDCFVAAALTPPTADAIRATIGLSVEAGIARLVPEGDAAQHSALADCYRDIYFSNRAAAEAAPEPLFDGIRAMLGAVAAAGWTLGIATGKSRRGLSRLLGQHDLLRRFATLQTADFHPSKPDPAMLLAACGETGIAAAATVVIGDTDFDMVMARRGGAAALGVSWGYQPAARLLAAGAGAIADRPDAIPALLDRLLEPRS